MHMMSHERLMKEDNFSLYILSYILYHLCDAHRVGLLVVYMCRAYTWSEYIMYLDVCQVEYLQICTQDYTEQYIILVR